MANIAIITARGGSKRIPRKNIRDFLGKPIIAYSIQAALESNLFDEVMVSTDDKEIADIAIACGAKVPFLRSEKTSDDYATTADVLEEVLLEYRKIGKNFEWLCCLYPTAPFVTGKRFAECMDKIKASGADGLIPVVKFSYPPQRAFIIDAAGELKFKYQENINTRSQDLESFYHDAGQFYFARADKFLASKSLLFKNTIPYVLDEMYVQDIDNLDDWQMAEFKYSFLQNDRN